MSKRIRVIIHGHFKNASAPTASQPTSHPASQPVPCRVLLPASVARKFLNPVTLISGVYLAARYSPVFREDTQVMTRAAGVN
ncbi:hypothetical protein E2C01_084634 [Portunus trituberculatus]|uniref:Uncharacterized protein n=1 Tax=Portunus trituberculatus TaxID=210409 RepID=A0A5B7IYT8_PORTR|nr:hypothetical protein [Portunus trituberculatus]